MTIVSGLSCGLLKARDHSLFISVFSASDADDSRWYAIFLQLCASISHFHNWSPQALIIPFMASHSLTNASMQTSFFLPKGFCTCHSFCQESSACRSSCSLFSSLIQFSLCSDCPREESYWPPIPNPSPTHRSLCYLGLINLLYLLVLLIIWKSPGCICTSFQSDLDMVLPWWCQWWRTRLPMQETQESWVWSLGWEDPLE